MKYSLKILLPFLVLTLTLSCGMYYTAFLNPEIRWLKMLNSVKCKAAMQHTKNRVLIIGGSTVLFSIDAQKITRIIGHHVINLGLHADMGSLALIGYADQFVKNGDTLILSIEPDLLSGKVDSRRLGNQFMFFTGNDHASMGGETFPKYRIKYIENLLDVASPGLRQIVNHAGKLILRRPIYRYSHLKPDQYGYILEKVYRAHPASHGYPEISHEWLSILKQYVDHLTTKGVRSVYSLPWFETDTNGPDLTCKIDLFLASINSIMPVVNDYEGVNFSDQSLFSDTSGHLSNRGAELRTQLLSEAMLNQAILPKGTLFIKK